MPIQPGDKLPDATFLQLGSDGPQELRLSDLTKGNKVVIFGLPGAYTGTCSTAHVPSFIRTIDDFRAKGVAHVICVSVNDPFVMAAWAKDTGADEAGITMLADAEGRFARAIDMAFTAEPVGLINRSLRYAMVADDGIVSILQAEENPGLCDTSGGEALLSALD